MPGGKRGRTATPIKNGKASQLLNSVMEDFDEAKGKIKSDFSGMGFKSVKELRDGLEKLFVTTVLPFMEKQVGHVSKLAEEVARLEAILEEQDQKGTEAFGRIEDMERVRESNEMKGSKMEMGRKMEMAQTQVKLLDVDFGKEITDGKELGKAAREAVAAKIRSDEKEKYDRLVKQAVVQVLAKQTVKRKTFNGDQEIWTAPVVFTIQDRLTRWDMEDTLRKSKMYPTFHWPREFLEPMKKIKTMLKDGGVDETKHFVRIRPEQKDGKWRIRADTKPRTGEGRFTMRAHWPIMAADGAIREKDKDWAKPTWAQIVAGGSGSNGSSNGSAAAMES